MEFTEEQIKAKLAELEESLGYDVVHSPHRGLQISIDWDVIRTYGLLSILFGCVLMICLK